MLLRLLLLLLPTPLAPAKQQVLVAALRCQVLLLV